MSSTHFARIGRWLCYASWLIPFGLQAETRVFEASIVLTGASAELSKADEVKLDELLSNREKNCVKNGAGGWVVWMVQAGRQESPDALRLRRNAIARWLQIRGADPRDIHNHDDNNAPRKYGIDVTFACTPSS